MIQHRCILTSCLPFGFRSDTEFRSFEIYWKSSLRTWHCTVTITGRTEVLWSSARRFRKLHVILDDLQRTQTQSNFRKVCSARWNCIIRPIVMLRLQARVTVLRTILVVWCVILVCSEFGILFKKKTFDWWQDLPRFKVMYSNGVEELMLWQYIDTLRPRTINSYSPSE